MDEKRHALLIGNQHYPEESGFAPLNSPHKDVRALEQILKDPKFGRFDAVTVLLDESYETTLIAIQNALRQKSRKDLLVIYYSGHGKTDDNNNLYLAAPNTRTENLEITSIDARRVAQMMGDSHAEKTILVLDCCHAGAFPVGFKSDDALQSVADRYANAGGSYVLMACGAYELARDGTEDDLSLLTKHLVEGIAGAADMNEDGIVTVNELTRYLDEIMSQGNGQKFNQSGQNKRGDIVLGWSGRTPVEHVVQQARIALHDWSMASAISDKDYSDVLKYFADLRSGEVDNSDPRWDLLQKVSKKEITSGEFLSGWLHAKLTRAQAETPPEPVPKPKPKTKPKPEPASATPPPKPKPEPKPEPEPEAAPVSPTLAQPTAKKVANNADPPAASGFFEDVLDFLFVDNEWLSFLLALGLFTLASAGVPALTYAIWPDLFLNPPYGFQKTELVVFAASLVIFTTIWTLVHADNEALDGFELVVPWMIRIVLLAPLSYWLLWWFSPSVAAFIL